MTTTMSGPQPWHEGELTLQTSIGATERMDEVGRRAVRDHMPDQHRDFFAKMPFLVLGSVDDRDDPWATLIAGAPGFAASPAPARLDIRLARDSGDPASEGVSAGKAIGLLGIELETRRRNRVNGVVGAAGPEGFSLDVEQSFGNCPQYIRVRDHDFGRDPALPFAGDIEESAELDAEARALIAAADTFFVASYAERAGRREVDVSHRGGRPGFVRIGADDALTIPDFSGNQFFATLGNILTTGRAGLVFIDFEAGDLLQMTGEAEVLLEGPEVAAFQGAERLWTFRPRRILRRRGALPIRWRSAAGDQSPNALLTGDWTQAAARLAAAEMGARWRSFRVARIVDEGASIRSFHLSPDDGAGLIPHVAGQHIPIRLLLPGAERPVVRTYSLSVAPSDGSWRISVKRDGVISTHLHDHVRTGDLIEARAPAGGFTIDAQAARPAVLLAGGVGLTPLLSMLRHVVYEGLRTGGVRPTVLVQAAHSAAELAFRQELDDLVDAAEGAVRVIRVLGDPTGAEPGVDFDETGRIDEEMLARLLPQGDFDAYVCGPSAFTQALYDDLRERGLADDRIHAEAFGPSALRRRPDGPAPVLTPAATQPVPVRFAASGRDAIWTPEAGGLLDLAEANGVTPEFSCRTGTCGTCRTKLLAGRVTYGAEPAAPHTDDEVLICCAVPAAEGETIELAL